MENYHLATVVVKIESGKHHQWMLNLRGNLDEENTGMILNCLPIDINCKGGRKKKNSNSTVEKLGKP